ncbi:winged helix-turn-helix domain-containing protein [Pseudomonadota bacterium]
MSDWTFFSNYGHVLVCLGRNREARLRDVAAEVGITERAVQKIVRDLQEAGYLVVSKQGRCNRYRINRRKTLRHSLESHRTVGQLLRLTARPGKQVDASLAAEPVSEQDTDQATVTGAADPVKEPPKLTSAKEKTTSPLDTRQQGSLF